MAEILGHGLFFISVLEAMQVNFYACRRASTDGVNSIGAKRCVFGTWNMVCHNVEVSVHLQVKYI